MTGAVLNGIAVVFYAACLAFLLVVAAGYFLDKRRTGRHERGGEPLIDEHEPPEDPA